MRPRQDCRPRRWALASLLAIGVVLPQPADAAIDEGELWELIGNYDGKAVAAYGPDVLPVLVRMYEVGNTEERAKIAAIFYQLGWKSEEAKRVLMRDIETLDETLRIRVQYALGRVSDDDEVVDALLDKMQTGFNPLVRDKAACGLAYDQIHLSEGQKVRLFRRLIELLDSPSRETRWLAIRVLQVHTGQTKGYQPAMRTDRRAPAVADWRRWVDEYEESL